MVEYGCQVANKYGMISDDEDLGDPQEFLERATIVSAERAAAQKKAEAPKPVVASKDIPKTAGKENRAAPSGDRGRGGRGRGTGRGGPRVPREPRDSNDPADRFGENRGRGGPRGGGRGAGGGRPFRGRGGPAGHVGGSEENKDASFDENVNENAPADFEGGRGRGRGGRGGYGSGERRGRGAVGFRGRQFDRQSGSDRSGVRASDKKDGHGRGNWGNQKDELAGETEAIPTEENVEVVPEVPREKTAEELAAEAEAAEIAKQKTLKEFKAAQKNDGAGFNIRRAGEGESQNFGKLVPIAREVLPEKEEEEVTYIRKNKKQLLDINIQFTEPNRGGRDREYRDRGSDRSPRGAGGRGGPRGGPRGGRGGGRPGATSVPFDASEDAFPALGAK